ncbi:meiotically up-regulated protein [Apiospora phragmitis]|uniref:Meiotically up-regulated protein n=1 Tax=Apiospora phragmitis TaxID=2905665 RepID=A0ABR1U6E8_9PEZI
MRITKKFDRAFQWAGEKMGSEAKTAMTDDFKNLETEMALRHDGMDRLQKSMNIYSKSISKRCESAEDKEKGLPISYMGRTMMSHGEDFEPDSEFGNCLIVMGRANESIAGIQENYSAQATAYWLESLERSLAMMKEYQVSSPSTGNCNRPPLRQTLRFLPSRVRDSQAKTSFPQAARKKLENRRLAYDAATTKVQKAKREDFRLEDELRAAKAKYEESSEDVFRRMQDIKEVETETVNDLTNFLDAELEYHERCAEELRRARAGWPAGQGSVPTIRGQSEYGGGGGMSRRPSQSQQSRSRSNTARSSDRVERWASRQDVYEEEEEEPQPEPVRMPIRSNRSERSNSYLSTANPRAETPVSPRPGINRASTYNSAYENNSVSPSRTSPTSYRKPPSLPRPATLPAPQNIGSLRGNLRPVSRISTNSNNNGNDVFGDDYDGATNSSGSPEYDRSESPATSYGSLSRTTSNVGLTGAPVTGKKAPPPPPPSRAKKPPPSIPAKRDLAYLS